MSLDLLNTVNIIEVMENYVAEIRPAEHVREQLDINYKIDNQSVVLYEIRPMFTRPEEKIEFCYAKATYVKSSNKWRCIECVRVVNGMFMIRCRKWLN